MSPSKNPEMTELQAALRLADKLLNEPNCDPDDDLRVLSRCLLRLYEKLTRPDTRDRTHIPPGQQRDPNARTWHWNEHPKGRFPK